MMKIKTVIIALLVFMFSCKGGAWLTGESSHFDKLQKKMIIELKEMGITDESLLSAMTKVPRHKFAPKGYEGKSYLDRPIQLGSWQAMATPYLTALRIQSLHIKPGEKVLEIGTESGYQAALLSEMGAKVYTIELIDKLAAEAKKRFDEMGYKNIHAICGDGFDGWPNESPFDAIIFACTPDEIPPKLIPQLKEGGRMVLSLGEMYDKQELIYVWKENGQINSRPLGEVRFPPMRGKILEKGD